MVNFNPSNRIVSFFKETIPNFITAQNRKIQTIFFTIIEFLNPLNLVRRVWNKPKDLNKENLPNVNRVKEAVQQKEPFNIVPNNIVPKEKEAEPDKPEEKKEPEGSKKIDPEKSEKAQEEPTQEISKIQEKPTDVKPQTTIGESKKADETTVIKTTDTAPQTLGSEPKTGDLKQVQTADVKPPISVVSQAPQASSQIQEPIPDKVISESSRRKFTDYREVLEYLKEHPQCKDNNVDVDLLDAVAKYFTDKKIVIGGRNAYTFKKIDEAIGELYKNKLNFGRMEGFYSEIKGNIAHALVDYIWRKPIVNLKPSVDEEHKLAKEEPKTAEKEPQTVEMKLQTAELKPQTTEMKPKTADVKSTAVDVNPQKPLVEESPKKDEPISKPKIAEPQPLFKPKKCTDEVEIHKYLENHPLCKENQWIRQNPNFLRLAAQCLVEKGSIISERNVNLLNDYLEIALTPTYEKAYIFDLAQFREIRVTIIFALYDYARLSKN